MKVRVYIATTEGPVAIQRLAAEDPEVRSVVCLNGTSEALPISPAYDAFVRKPTGVVERLVGHPVFRMDVSDRISEGRSWQLGIFVAHLLKDEGRLAELDDKADHVIWLTGEVNQSLEVLPVSHLDLKLEKSSKLFSECSIHKIPILFVIPKANLSQLTQPGKSISHTDLPIIGITSISQLIEKIDIKLPHLKKISDQPTATRTSVPGTSTNNSIVRKVKLAVAILCVSVGAIWALNTLNPSIFSTDEYTEFSIDTTKGNPIDLASTPTNIRLIELRPPKYSNCAAVRFGKAEPTLNEAPINGSDRFYSTNIRSLCGIRLVLASQHDSIDIRPSLSVTQAGEDLRRRLRDKYITINQEGNETRWQIRFNRTLRQEFSYTWKLFKRDDSNKNKLWKSFVHSGNL